VRSRQAAGVVLLAAVSLLPFFWYAWVYTEPFERDEAVYATVARVIRNGGLPYRDIFDHKPPLLYGWYTASFALFGETISAPRILAAAALAATTPLIFLAARGLYGTAPAGHSAASAFAISTGLLLLRGNANPEVFMVLPLTGALVFAVWGIRSGQAGPLVMAGTLSGAAIATKQVAAWNTLALLLAVTLAARQKGRAFWPDVAAMAGGVALALGAVTLPFVLAGAWGEYWFANVTYNLQYIGQYSAGQKAVLACTAAVRLLLIATPWVVLSAIGVRVLLRRRDDPSARMILLWASGAAVGVATSGRFYANNFIQLLPAMALLVPAAVDVVLRPRAGQERWLMHAAVVLTVGTCAMANLTVYMAGGPRERHIAKFGEAYGRRSNEAMDLGAYLASQTRDGERIYNFGRESEIYFYANRAPAARYLYDRPFWLFPETLTETLAELERTRPRFIIDTLVPPRIASGDFLADTYDAYHPPAVLAFLHEHYEYLGRIHDADIYRLKEQGHTSQ
jgi:4-amino-4-deoxy-L-arabinose transferase-like glycosyltransferase